MIWRWENRWFLVDFPLNQLIFMGKSRVSGEDFPLNLNQSIELWFLQMNWWFFINPKSEVNQLRYCMVSILFNTDLDMNCTQLNTSEYYVCNTLPGQCNNMRKLCFLARVIIWSKQIQVMSFMHFCSGRPRHRMPMMQLFFWPVLPALNPPVSRIWGMISWNYPWKWSDIHWSEICLDIWGIISWNGVRRDIHWKYLKHLIWLTSLEWWLVRIIIPTWPYFSYFRFCELSQFKPGLRLAQVPTEGTYKKEQMRVM